VVGAVDKTFNAAFHPEKYLNIRAREAIMGEVRAGSEPAGKVARESLQEQEAEEQQEEQEEVLLEEKLLRHVHPAKSWLFAATLITLFIAVISSIMTDSGMLYAILGFLPAIATTIIFILLIEGDYKDVLFWLTPLAVLFLVLAVGPAFNDMISGQLDIPVLAGLNLILSYLILGIMEVIEYHRTDDEQPPTEFKPENLEQYIHTIEDKCKALNFVIGRVYRASHGGTKSMREKIKIPSEWYNEFNAIKPEDIKEKRHIALGLLTRIQDRLAELLKPEKELFTPKELEGLKIIERDKDGKDRVIDVLTVNDSDPVEDYYLGAVDFCKRFIVELKKR